MAGFRLLAFVVLIVKKLELVQASSFSKGMPMIWNEVFPFDQTRSDPNFQMLLKVNLPKIPCVNSVDSELICFEAIHHKSITLLDSVCGDNYEDFLSENPLDLQFTITGNQLLHHHPSLLDLPQAVVLSVDRKKRNHETKIKSMKEARPHKKRKAEKIFQLLSPTVKYGNLLQHIFGQTVLNACHFDKHNGFGLFSFQRDKPDFKVHILQANPFMFYDKSDYDPVETENTLGMALQYIGPRYVASIAEHSCLVDFSSENEEKLILIPLNSKGDCFLVNQTPVHKLWKKKCIMQQNNSTANSTSEEESINPNPIQIKKVGDAFFVYCYGFNILLQKKVEVCPNYVISFHHLEPFEFISTLPSEENYDSENTFLDPDEFSSSDLTMTMELNKHFQLNNFAPELLLFELDDNEENCTTGKAKPKVQPSSSISKPLAAAAGVGGGLAGAVGFVKVAKNYSGKKEEAGKSKDSEKNKSAKSSDDKEEKKSSKKNKGEKDDESSPKKKDDDKTNGESTTPDGTEDKEPVPNPDESNDSELSETEEEPVAGTSQSATAVAVVGSNEDKDSEKVPLLSENQVARKRNRLQESLTEIRTVIMKFLDIYKNYSRSRYKRLEPSHCPKRPTDIP